MTNWFISLYDHKLSYVIDWNQTRDIDINVMLKRNEFTSIKVRKSPDNLSDSILTLHRRLKNESPNSCRHKYGDKGRMFVLGKKDEKELI